MSAQDPTPADRLAGTDLFQGLSRRHLKKVAELSRTVQHPPGRQVATEGLGALAFHLDPRRAGQGHQQPHGDPHPGPRETTSARSA